MWIEERCGKYRYSERYKDPMTGKTKKVSVTLEKNTASARKKASAMLQKMIDAALCDSVTPGNLTLQELISKYAEHQSKTVKKSTAERNGFEAKAVARILDGDSIADRLTVAHVMEKLLSAGETATCTNARIKYIKALFRWGYKSDLLPSPALADKLEYLPDYRKKEKLADKYMEVEELEAVLDAMTVDRWRLLTEFLCLSGIRIGELIALNDYDVSDKYIHVSKTFDLRTEILSDTPKTDSSNRDVYIQPELADCIRKIRKERKIMELSGGIRSRLFFPARDGGYMHYHAYRKYLAEITEKAIGRKLTPHACRHTMVSIFAAQGAGLEAIGRRLGHSGTEVTRAIYYHVTAEQRKKDEEQISAIKVLKGG